MRYRLSSTLAIKRLASGIALSFGRVRASLRVLVVNGAGTNNLGQQLVQRW